MGCCGITRLVSSSPGWLPRARHCKHSTPRFGCRHARPRQTKNLTNITEASSQCEVHAPAAASVLRGRAKDSALRAGVVYVVVKKWSRRPIRGGVKTLPILRSSISDVLYIIPAITPAFDHHQLPRTCLVGIVKVSCNSSIVKCSIDDSDDASYITVFS